MCRAASSVFCGPRLRDGHHRAPVAHPGLRRREEGAVLLATQPPVQLRQRLAAVADQPDLDRMAQADALRVAVDLHPARLPGLRVVFDVREGRADDQHRVAGLHRLP
jgi:hypothetical protein